MFNNQSHYGSMAQGFMSKVYGWMCLGLATTASVMFYLAPEMNPSIIKTIHTNFLFLIGLFVVQFGILMYMKHIMKLTS